MKILHVIPTYVPAYRHGGPVYAVHGLAKAQVALGHEVTVFTTDVHGDDRLKVPLGKAVDVEGVETWYFPVLPPRRLYWSPRLGRALRQRLPAYDVAHLHSLFLYPTLAAARAAERARVPYLVAPRGMLVPELVRRRGRLRKRLWLALFERRTLKRAAGLHVTAEVEAAEAAKFGLVLPPIFCVPNGIDPEPLRFDPAATLSPAVRAALNAGPFMLCLGRVSWKKGIDRLIEALPRAPGAALVIAGNDEEGLTPRLLAQAQQLGVGERVIATGAVAGADKAALLAGASLLVLPSSSENFGNSVLEAMTVGKPVVVTAEVGLAAVVAETGAGLVVSAEPALLGNALAGLMAHKERRDEMGRRGAAAAAEHFGWPAVARRMVEVYAQISSEAAGR